MKSIHAQAKAKEDNGLAEGNKEGILEQ